METYWFVNYKAPGIDIGDCCFSSNVDYFHIAKAKEAILKNIRNEFFRPSAEDIVITWWKQISKQEFDSGRKEL
jgi:hypothetical protein